MSEQHAGRVRGFPAFRPGSRPPGRFARSWWGNAWIKALRDTSLDEEPLRQGRKYAYAGRVGTITVSPGRIAAPVYGVHDAPYRTVVFVEQLTDAEWGRFLDQVAAKAGHIAALLDKDMPHDLVEAAADAGVRLLPGMGDLEPECGCPDWGHPCKHAAALCYQASWLLDEDPFVLLLMRGRGRPELMEELQRRNVRQAGTPAPALAGHAAGPMAEPAGPEPGSGDVPPLPAPPPPAAADDLLGVLSAVPPAPGVDPSALQLLTVDAAARARELLSAEEPPPVLDLWQDTVRMAATHRDVQCLNRLRQAVLDGDPDGGHGRGRSEPELARAVRAWRYGGLPALDVLEASGGPALTDSSVRADLARARATLARARDGGAWEAGDGAELPEPRVWRNRWTVAGLGVQLRYGADGHWYPYRREAGAWWPAGPAERDPAAAVAELLGG